MRTKVLNHFHTFHPDAQDEFDRLSVEEKRLTRAVAREADEIPDHLTAALASTRAAMDVQRVIIASGVVRVTLKGLSRGEFRRALTAHPPRDGDELDARLGYNVDTFGDALIAACILRTDTLDGDPIPNEWPRWADDMTNGQWDEFFTACMRLTNDPAPAFPR